MAGPVRILFVIFKPDEKSNDHTTTDMVTVIEKFKNKNPKALIDYTFAVGEFNRAVGLHTGVSQCDDNEIVLFLDVDLKVGPDFLGRIRRNTIQHRKVIFPIMYSQYDPDILVKAAAVDADLQFFTVNNMDINKQTGFWIYYAYGVAAMYKSDYVKVGGFRLDIRGWGGEDVDLFKKMVADTQLDVMSIVDPDLIHIYHKRGCDIELASDQYDMCVGAWAETLGSQVEIASLYLDSHRKQHKGALL
ncbi:chondroitin sulfate synthase 3-like [Clavelina lepadiformis]